ncbi:metal ABC transporter solute-binding protein, Zn/Mn family [Pediococcus argentinicus]|uniref:metal ABC transporter solute-binding protein, Zn/Mn family n=1 Tax=Pediococcus argentinicus TaxID=480391 RepID=UPI0035315FAF
MLHRILAWGFFLSIVFALVGCAKSNNTAKQKGIQIATTTDFYGEVAKAVVGDKGQVKSIINNPNVDPHDYEPTTSVAKQVATSDIIVANGVGYDGWMDKLAQSKKSNYIRIGNDSLHLKDGVNPHLWYRADTMKVYAQDLATRLGKRKLKDKEYFQKNAQNYIKSLKPIDEKLSKIKSLATKTKNKTVFVSEPVFDYALKSTGFKVGNPSFENSIEKEVDPSPKDIRQMQQSINGHKIAFFVYNKQVDSKIVDNLVNLANDNDVPVLPVTETLPKGQTYIKWMDHQYDRMLKILQK